jgi:hemerythrin-like domain-containing protein
MYEIQHKEIINRLEAIYETLWTLDSQKQLMKALEMFTELIVKQTEVAEKQQKLLKRIEKSLNDENEETENKILFS